MRYNVLTPRFNGQFQYHIVFGIGQKRSPQKENLTVTGY